MTAEELKIILEGLSDSELKSEVYIANKCQYFTIDNVKLETSLTTCSSDLVIEVHEC